jgi:putative hemolysin
MLGELPRAGDFLEWEDMRFEIMDMDGRRVDKILIELAAGGTG